MGYRLLGDVVMLTHFAFLAFVVLGGEVLAALVVVLSWTGFVWRSRRPRPAVSAPPR